MWPCIRSRIRVSVIVLYAISIELAWVSDEDQSCRRMIVLQQDFGIRGHVDLVPPDRGEAEPDNSLEDDCLNRNSFP